MRASVSKAKRKMQTKNTRPQIKPKKSKNKVKSEKMEK